MIKAVIFDMFETLVTLFAGKTYFSEDAAADTGIDLETYRKAWHENEKARATGKLTFEEGVAETLRKLGVYSEDKVSLIMAHRLDALKDTFGAIPEGSVKLLAELKKRGVRTGLITNAFSDERDLIRASKLFPYFDAVRISCETGVLKPDPEMYVSVMDELGVKPDECLYVGDGGSRELTAAKELGMHAVQAVWFRDGFFEPHVPSPVFPEFPQAEKQEDILAFLETEAGE